MFAILDKIDKALTSQQKCVLIDKTGKYYHGIVTDSWARLSGGKQRGKVVFKSEEKGEFEIDINDVLDVRL